MGSSSIMSAGVFGTSRSCDATVGSIVCSGAVNTSSAGRLVGGDESGHGADIADVASGCSCMAWCRLMIDDDDDDGSVVSYGGCIRCGVLHWVLVPLPVVVSVRVVLQDCTVAVCILVRKVLCIGIIVVHL